MKVITYLAFTVLSIAIQFVVMDLILDKTKEDDPIVLNETTSSPKEKFSDILKKYGESPQALYLRVQEGIIVKKHAKKNNDSIPETTFETTTDISSTLIGLLYEDNTTITENFSTTDSVYSTIEFDNVTEIAIFGKKNASEVKPKITTKKTVSQDCSCNLLFKVCDINCCCDSDCSDAELQIFSCALHEEQSKELCYSEFSHQYMMGSNLDRLFCVVKNNLPDKRNIVVNKHNPSVLDKSFRWHSKNRVGSVQEFKKTHYTYGSPVWLLHNGSIFYVDLPTTTVNNYCDDRKPLRFLRDENIKCHVKLSDLEILQILTTADKTSVISITEKSLNTSALNCTTLHCTNWTIIICNETICLNYNKSLHDPLCTDNICTDLALKVHYTFHYYENKIMNASIKLFTEKVPLSMPFIEQEINIKFIIANESSDKIIELSGNSGYIPGLPVIASKEDANHTDKFFNNISKLRKYLTLPENKKAKCARSNMTETLILFGTNRRMKCRFFYEHEVPQSNETETCKNIQNNLIKLLELDKKISVAPLGNPAGLSDDEWISLKVDTPDVVLYGELDSRKTKLYCYNMINRYSFIFTYAVNDAGTKKELKILSAKVDVATSNVTFSIEDASVVVTVDTIFIDETKPSVFEYAGGPLLNIHLPKDFFFPFPSKACCTLEFNSCVIVFIALLIISK